MEDAFGTLIWIVTGLATVVAIFTLAGTARSYREIGGAGLAPDDKQTVPTAVAERDEEIRQMLDASNTRRVRRGEAPLDVEARFAALTDREPAAVLDDELREEIRHHVLARNARRVRAGGEPLHVEAEIERQIRELT